MGTYTQELVEENFLRLVFSSEIALVDKAVADAVAFIKSKNIIVNSFSLKLAFYEAFTNAVRHGNLNDPQKNVKGEIKTDDKFIYIRVEDEGNGFNWRNAMAKKRLSFKDTSGRGLILLRSYDYNPEYNEKGNILFLKKEYTQKPQE